MFFNLMASASAIVNVVALVLLLFFALHGMINGFVKTLISLFGTVISFLIAILLCPNVITFLQTRFMILDKLAGSLSGFLEKTFGSELMGMTIEQAETSNAILSGFGGLIIKTILKIKGTDGITETMLVSEVLPRTFAYYLLLVLAVLVLFILFKLIFAVLVKFIEKAHSISMVSGIDKTLGFFLGIISGVINLEFIILVIGLLPFNFCQTLYQTIISSEVGGFLANINLISLIMQGTSIPKLNQIINVV